jgi:hypothetical protein
MAQKCSFVKNFKLWTWNPTLNELGKLAKDKHRKQKYFDKLKRRLQNLDYVMQDLHDAEFKKTDCLKCANCCKTILYSLCRYWAGVKIS